MSRRDRPAPSRASRVELLAWPLLEGGERERDRGASEAGTLVRPARQLLRLVRTVALPLCLAACTTTVFAPQGVDDPAGIAILDHGRHASLILEVPDGSMVRYAYGDWRWYALQQTGPLEGSAAVLWPTQAALGRARLAGPFSSTAVAQQVRPPIEHAVYLVVSARAVRRLADRLDRTFHENSSMQVYNEVYDLVFVPHPDRYSITHNSNQVTADWLEELGCRVEGPAVLSVWKRGSERP